VEKRQGELNAHAFLRARVKRLSVPAQFFQKRAGLTTTPEKSDCRCFLPDLTGFADARRMGPDRHEASPIRSREAT